MYVGKTERSVRTRKREHVDGVKIFNTKKSSLSQPVLDFDHRIDWDDVKIIKVRVICVQASRCGKFFDKSKGSFM